MLGAVWRSALLTARPFGNLCNVGVARWLDTIPSLPALMIGGLREKSCLKTNKSAAKRFIVRGNGRIKRGRAGRSHNTGHKGRKRVNRLATSTGIREKAIEDRMRVLIRAP
ncbi:hypothetical protein ACHAWF_006387 [Thalassiosira exigua]